MTACEGFRNLNNNHQKENFMTSINKATVLGYLGNDPAVRSMQSGKEVCNLSIATSTSYKDKNTGVRTSTTEWHKVSVFGPGLIETCKKHLAKGDLIYIEGALKTQKYEKAGAEHKSTEIVVSGYNSKIEIVNCAAWANENKNHNDQINQASPHDYDDDGIPF